MAASLASTRAPRLSAEETNAAQAEGAEHSANAADAVDGYVAREMDRYKIPGMSVAIVRQGRITKHRGYGLNDLELSAPATSDTVYQIASVSKLFAGVATMLLVQDGRVSLDASVVELLPGAPESWRRIRLHHLLEHASGLPRVEANPRYVQELQRRRNRELFADGDKLDYFTGAERLAHLAELPLVAPAGSTYDYGYSQSAFMLAGLVIERLASMRYAEFLRTRVFDPLGMTSARFGDSRVIVPGRRQVAYTRQYGPLQNWLWPYSTTDYPSAGLNVSAPDLARLFVALQSGTLLRPTHLQRMWSPGRFATGAAIPYALGWTVGMVGPHRSVGHEGGGCAWVTHLPERQLTAIALCNLAGARADRMADDLARLLVDATEP